MTNQFWLSDPTILLNKQHILELWPNRNMDKNDKLNAISRLIILLTVVGFLYTRELKMLITGLITLVVIVLVNKCTLLPGLPPTVYVKLPLLSVALFATVAIVQFFNTSIICAIFILLMS